MQGYRGFVDLVTHPWVVAMSEAALGPDYQIVEIGCDTPFQGAKVQPWHRDRTKGENLPTSLIIF